MSNALLRAALQYADRGLYVFPCRPRAKNPIPEHGLLEATLDGARIREWWAAYPDANIAISCGPSGIVVLDVDPRHGGDASFEGLRAELGGDMFNTKTQTTPSGGTHYLFRAPAEPISNSAGLLGPGLDIRAAGGYILVPPSTNGAGGYVWEVGSKDVTLLDFPQMLREKLGPKLAVFEAADAVIEGGRDNYLTSMAGALRRKGLSASEIHAALTIANRDRCKPPLEAQDVARIATSVGRYEPADPIQQHGNDGASSVVVAMSTTEFLAGEDAVEHLIEGLIPAAGSAIVGGKKKSGKGVLLLNMAVAVARGDIFLGRRCRQGTVLYLSLDESASITRERAHMLGITASDPIVWVASRTRPRDWASWLHGIVAEHRPTLLIADTIVKLAGIKKIEDYGEWLAAYNPLYGLAEEFGCAFIGSAHNRKVGEANPDAIAGSTAAAGGVDSIIVIERALDNTRYIMTEQRHGEDIERCVLHMDQETLMISIGAEAWLIAQREVEQRVLDVLADGRLTREEIIQRASRRGLSVKRALAALIDAGLIIRQGRGLRGDPARYAINRGPSGTN